MILRENVPVAEFTTFHLGGPARVVIDCASEHDVQAALAYIRERGLSFVVLGEGSNVLPNDEGYAGAIIRMTSDGITVREEGDAVYMTADAGVSWDALVWSAAEHGAWGIENLAGIPGTVGAAPVQNIGAYGAELKNVYAHARVLDSSTGVISDVSRSDTAFSYRDSRFKHEPNLIILAVTLVLSRKGAPHIGYADLEAARASGTDLSTPRTIGEAVRSIRSHKFPDIREYGTAGSFFKNPILTPTQFAELSERYGAIPSFPSEHGIKVPLAFILDRVLNLRGYRKGNVWLFGNQPLVLVADRTARAHEVEDLAQEIEQRVFNETNIKIEREVRLLEAHEAK